MPGLPCVPVPGLKELALKSASPDRRGTEPARVIWRVDSMTHLTTWEVCNSYALSDMGCVLRSLTPSLRCLINQIH